MRRFKDGGEKLAQWNRSAVVAPRSRLPTSLSPSASCLRAHPCACTVSRGLCGAWKANNLVGDLENRRQTQLTGHAESPVAFQPSHQIDKLAEIHRSMVPMGLTVRL